MILTPALLGAVDCSQPEPSWWPASWAWRLGCDWPTDEEADAAREQAVRDFREAQGQDPDAPILTPAEQIEAWLPECGLLCRLGLAGGGALGAVAVAGAAALIVDGVLFRFDGTRLIADLARGR